MIHCRDRLAGYVGLMEGNGVLSRNRIYPIFPGPDLRVDQPYHHPGYQPINGAEMLMEESEICC